MQNGEDPDVDIAIKEIGALLAEAYARRSRIRLVQTTSEPPTLLRDLANSDPRSVHGSRLTAEEKESSQNDEGQ